MASLPLWGRGRLTQLWAGVWAASCFLKPATRLSTAEWHRLHKAAVQSVQSRHPAKSPPRRKLTHRAAYDDACRWRLHLAPTFGKLRPAEADAGRIRALVEAKLAEELDAATVSTFYSDLRERPRETGVTLNPVHSLPRSTRRLVRPRHDPKDTPFLEKLSDVRRVFQALEKPFNVAFAVGSFGGLRTGEVLALDWEKCIDLVTQHIRLREQV